MDFQSEGLYIHLKKISLNEFSLYVNNILFKNGMGSKQKLNSKENINIEIPTLKVDQKKII